MSELEEVKNVVVSVVSGREFTCCGWGVTFRKLPLPTPQTLPKTEVAPVKSDTPDAQSKVEVV